MKYNSSGKGVKEQQETVRKEVEGRRENSSEEDEDKRTTETTVDFEPRPDCLQAILNNNQPVVEVDCESAITVSSDLCCSSPL